MSPVEHAPNIDEVEVSLFGPGIGESVVVHAGAGEWLVIDSCMDRTVNRPVSLEYLENRLGLDVGRAVRLVMATHWHDDHTAGLAAVLRAASNAEFVCSAALQQKEFLALVDVGNRLSLVDQSTGVSEFAEIIEIQNSRKKRGPDRWVLEGLPVWNGTSGCKVVALSPSHDCMTTAASAIGALVPRPGQQMKKVPNRSPNEMSVAVHVQNGDHAIVLGADLQTVADRRRGWRAAVSSSLRPRQVATVFKVAHHGSENADYHGIWEELLVANAHALIAPYGAGRKKLPSDDDLDRIRKRTDRCFLTRHPNAKPSSRDKAVEKTMREIVTWHRSLHAKPGHLRLRLQAGDSSPRIEMFDGAMQV